MAGVGEFTELECWQLATELKRRVYAILARDPACRDFDFCRQIRKSAASAPRNIAEGFGRFTHREMSQYLKVALGSLRETQDALIDAHDLRYISADELKELQAIAGSAVRTTKAFKRSVDNSSDPE